MNRVVHHCNFGDAVSFNGKILRNRCSAFSLAIAKRCAKTLICAWVACELVGCADGRPEVRRGHHPEIRRPYPRQVLRRFGLGSSISGGVLQVRRRGVDS